MKKIISQIVSAILICGFVLINFDEVPALADSGSCSKQVTANGNSQIYTKNSVQWYNNGKNDMFLGDFEETITGTASNLWMGSTPFDADSISMTNTVSCDKWLGSFSVSGNVGTSGSSAGVGVSISSTSTSKDYTYSVTNNFILSVSFTYIARVTGSWLVADMYFETTAVTQLGSSFYHTTTGVSHISL